MATGIGCTNPGMPLSRHATGPSLEAMRRSGSVSTRPLAAVIERLPHHDLGMEAGG